MTTEAEYQKKQRAKAVVAVYLIMQGDKGKILLMLRDGTGYQDGNWDLPSGHVEEGEMPNEAIQREAREEVGIEVRLADLKLVHVSYRPKHDKTGDRVDFFFSTTQWIGQVSIMEPSKCKDLTWRYPSIIDSPFALPPNMVPQVRVGILNWAEEEPFSMLNKIWLKAYNLYKL